MMTQGINRGKVRADLPALLATDVPQALRVLRAAQGWTQHQLAQKLGRSRSQISRWEGGQQLRAGEREQLVALWRKLFFTDDTPEPQPTLPVPVARRTPPPCCAPPKLRPRAEERREAPAPVRRAPQPTHQEARDEGTTAQAVTIDWQRFAFVSEEARGISLRAMVEAGLYAEMRIAVRALNASGVVSALVSAQTSEHGGRPEQDHILSLADAQFFAASAQTETGRAILRTIIDHHNEFQAMLAGDTKAWQRTAEEAQRRAEQERAAEDPLLGDPMLAQLRALADTRERTLRMEAELEQQAEEQRRQAGVLEQQAEVLDELLYRRRQRPNEKTLAQLAASRGWLTSGGRPHNNAVALALANHGFHTEEQGVRQIEVEAPEGHATGVVPKTVISGEALEVWPQIARTYEKGARGRGVLRIDPIRGSGRASGANVHLAEHHQPSTQTSLVGVP